MVDTSFQFAFSHAGEEFVLVPPVPGDADAYVSYLSRNWPRFRGAMPTLDSAVPLDEALRGRFDALLRNALPGAVSLLLFRDGERATVLGDITFSNIVRGSFRACYLGFKIDAAPEGRGVMRRSLELACAEVSARFGLHRIMANYRPENARSGNLLRRLGFEREGLAREYLHLDGAWRDHVLTALIIGAAK